MKPKKFANSTEQARVANTDEELTTFVKELIRDGRSSKVTGTFPDGAGRIEVSLRIAEHAKSKSRRTPTGRVTGQYRGRDSRYQGRDSLTNYMSVVGLSEYIDDTFRELELTLRNGQADAAEPASETFITSLLDEMDEVPPEYEGWAEADADERRAILARAAESGKRQRVRSAAQGAASLLRSSLDQKSVASLLGVDKSRVSRQTAEGKLYSTRLGRRVLYPEWQFMEGNRLPHLEQVISAVNAEGFDARSVEQFMTLRREELSGQSPRDYLAAGGDPGVVLSIIEGWAWR